MAPMSSPEQSSINVEIRTSGATLSRSSASQFITLNARTDSDQAITIDSSRTVLQTGPKALGYQGLTFKDHTTGDFAERITIDVQYQLSATLSSTSESIVAILETHATESYQVAHSFKEPTKIKLPPTPSSRYETVSELRSNAVLEQVLTEISDQASGLQVGNSYEIGLGNHMSSIAWWRKGTRAEVFAGRALSRQAVGPRLRMVLANTAMFEVVE